MTNYSISDFEELQLKSQNIIAKLEQLDVSEWQKKKDLIEEYIIVNRTLRDAGKLDIVKKDFCSYIISKLTERNITVNQNGNFYRMFNDDEKDARGPKSIDQKSIEITSAMTVDEKYKDRKENIPQKQTRYTKYLENENKTLDDAKSLNSALLEKYNESPEIQKIMDDNFDEKMISDLISIHSTINLAREYVDDRNKLTDYQKLNLQLLINLGQTKAQAARDVNYCSKYASIGIERSEDLTKLWDFLGECHVCHSDIKETRDKALRDYKSGNELDFDIPVKGY